MLNSYLTKNRSVSIEPAKIGNNKKNLITPFSVRSIKMYPKKYIDFIGR